jgi:hypothetical protein
VTRPCGCPGAPGARHLDGCPERGRRRSGPSVPYAEKKRRGVSTGNPARRLPERVAELAAELVDAGREDEVVEALEGLQKRRQRGTATERREAILLVLLAERKALLASGNRPVIEAVRSWDVEALAGKLATALDHA